MEKTYNPKHIEPHWQERWEKHQYGKPSGKGTPYCIMLPPPNVTGTLHMGHGFQHTLMDALIRYHRMQGYNTLWQGGTDHAGIATQIVVEQQLIKQGQSRHGLGREKFVEHVWAWQEKSGDTITQQMRRLGLSLDWSRLRFSMDEDINTATIEAFARLYKEGLIYRGKRLVNWDPVLQSAVSDLEVETEESQGTLWHIQYPLTDGSGEVIVATTRPETMLGDIAVAVHPEDERYQKLIGKTVKLPLTDRAIPIVADEYVDKEFGSGCVKITPAHDFNDHEIGKRHHLPLINIFNDTAHLNENAPKAYQGLERFEARKKIIADLKKQNLLFKEEVHTLSIPRTGRTGAIVEPYLTDQWFVKTKELAGPALNALEKGELHFIPDNWKKTYRQWLENIEDWCISRQLWWGHRIPVWYDDEKNTYVGHNEVDVRKKYKLKDDVKLIQDNDVLDTWFTASLHPFSTLDWPEKSPELKTFYPTNVLVTGFDIIFFWVARMVMMGIKLTGQVPFHTVYITGLIRDRFGKKMSKSKGNVLDPIDLIDGITLDKLIQKRTITLLNPKMQSAVEKHTREEFPEGIKAYGTDALRFTFCALANTGRDINFDIGRIEGYRNFCNKLWNATRFVLMNVENQDIDSEKPLQFNEADNWIRSRLQHTIKAVHEHFEHYRFDLLANALYEFVWNEYCDWYLELAKCTLNNNNAKAAELRGTRVTLLEVLETILRLLHPVMPFITEEIWQKIAPMVGIKGPTIMLAKFPEFDKKQVDEKAEKAFQWEKDITTAIRTIRSEMNVNPGKRIPVLLNKGNQDDKKYVDSLANFVKALARVDKIEWVTTSETLSETATATAVIKELEVHIPLAGIIDKDAELKRLNREMEKLQKEIGKSESMLNNKNYIEKAPKPVVDKAKEKLAQAKLALEKLQAQCEKLT